MMKPEAELSPLDQIQQAEAEVIRRVAAAREVARLINLKAQEEAEAILREAEMLGQQEGKIQYDSIITDAHAEARAILEQAHQRAEAFHTSGEAHKTSIIHRAVNIVLGIWENVDHP